MNELESRVRVSDPKIADLEKKFSEKSTSCDNFAAENLKLKKKLEDEKRRLVELEMTKNESSSFVKPEKNVSFYIEKIEQGLRR